MPIIYLYGPAATRLLPVELRPSPYPSVVKKPPDDAPKSAVPINPKAPTAPKAQQNVREKAQKGVRVKARRRPATKAQQEAMKSEGLIVDRKQIVLTRPIKELGLHNLTVNLHPEVDASIEINVARSEEEADIQKSGKTIQDVKMDIVVFESKLENEKRNLESLKRDIQNLKEEITDLELRSDGEKTAVLTQIKNS